MYRIDNNHFYYNDTLIISFEQNISDFIDLEMPVILIESSENKPLFRNIFCVDKQGKILWQIDKEIENSISIKTPYTSIYRENNQLKGYNRAGYEVVINPRNGKVLEIDFIK